MNTHIIEQFNLLVKQVQAEYLNAQVENNPKEMTMHQFRLKSIKNALRAIKVLDFEIKDESDVKGVPGIGEGTRKRIKEILTTGTLTELKNKYDKKKQTTINSIQELEKVIGIGSSIAKNLVVKHNIKSIDDLKKAIKTKKITVNDKVLLGLKYYGIHQVAIPRKEIETIEKYLVKETHKIDPKLEIMICGSYRRGKTTSGDIDVLMYHPNIKTMKQILHPDENYDSNQKKKFGNDSYLEIFVDNLTNQKFLLDHLTDKHYNMKYMGFCQYKDFPVRRIDIRFIPYNSLGPAMLYFTGPYELNTVMRNAAKKRNMLLNEYGLFKLDENEARIALNVKSEADVFKALGMDYLTPEERETFSTGKNKIAKV